MLDNKGLRFSFLFALLGALFFIPFLGNVHLFDWDEINFAEISREMIVLDDYLRVHINFEPFWEKPPLFFWLQVVSMKLFGINEFAARLPNAITGIFTLIVLFKAGQKLHSTRFGVLWAFTYFGTVLPHLYFRSGIIDPVLNLFIFAGLWFMIAFVSQKGKSPESKESSASYLLLFWSGLFIGLGMLTKGPVAFLIPIGTMIGYWISIRFRMFISIPQFLFFTVCCSLVSLAWYGVEYLQNGSFFILEFIRYQFRLFSTADAGHSGFPGFHIIVLLIGCFPASVFCIKGLLRSPEKDNELGFFRKWMVILLVVVLLIFMLVRSKIVHYSSMAYFPVTFLSAYAVLKIAEEKIRFTKGLKTGLISLGALFIIAFFCAPILGRNLNILTDRIKDPFVLANLQAEVNWTGWEILPGLVLLFSLILGLLLINRQKFIKGYLIIFGGTAVMVWLALAFYIGRIEAYSQRAAIEFMESKAEEDCYFLPVGYKTYAHHFYGKQKQHDDPESKDAFHLLTAEMDKEVYIITKIHKTVNLKDFKDNLTEIGRKNGFVFYKRKKSNQTDE